MDHITLQHLRKADADCPDALAVLTEMGALHPHTAFSYGANMDALFQGTRSSLPPAIILDYMYGVAAYNRWRIRQGDDEGHSVMKNYHKEHYADILAPPHRPPSDGDDLPPTPPQQSHYTSTRRGDVMANAMDKLNLV
jgi:hypothetical protein